MDHPPSAFYPPTRLQHPATLRRVCGEMLKVGERCDAHYEGGWYRAKVTSVSGPPNPTIKVLFPGYNNEESLTPNLVRAARVTPGWSEVTTADGYVYFQNKAGEYSWDVPEVAVAPPVLKPKPMPLSKPIAAPKLKPVPLSKPIAAPKLKPVPLSKPIAAPKPKPAPLPSSTPLPTVTTPAPLTLAPQRRYSSSSSSSSSFPSSTSRPSYTSSARRQSRAVQSLRSAAPSTSALSPYGGSELPSLPGRAGTGGEGLTAKAASVRRRLSAVPPPGYGRPRPAGQLGQGQRGGMTDDDVIAMMMRGGFACGAGCAC